MIFAAAAVMVAVFFTFAISGPLPPKEMGVILGVAVLLDALLVRLVLVPVRSDSSGARPGASQTGSTGSFPTSASATDTDRVEELMLGQPPVQATTLHRCHGADRT